ncbi:MAG: DUF2147 domain-containing protein [Treponema sp.]|nr:DUF2147 domain-containing protein [Treponema sp.]
MIGSILGGIFHRRGYVFAALLIPAVSGLGFAQDPAEGYWLSVDEKSGKITAGWEIYQLDHKLYGKVLSSAEPDQPNRCKESYRDFPVAGRVNEMPMIGTPWIFGLSTERPGRWRGGYIIDPTTGNLYRCRIIFHGADGNRYKTDTLEMRGEIVPGIGRSQFWRRATREIALSQHS